MQKTYVVDTSVLLVSGRRALYAFAEHNVVIPLVVIKELESKRHDDVLGPMARSALRELEHLREYGDLRYGVPLNDLGGTLRIEINHKDASSLPDVIREDNSHDTRILNVAFTLNKELGDGSVVLVSQDLPMRILAQGALGIPSEEYRHDKASDDTYVGLVELLEEPDVLDDFYKTGSVANLDEDHPINTGVVLRSYDGRQSALGCYVSPHTAVHVNDLDVFGVRGRSVQQKIALHHMMNNDIDIVSLGGSAGTGKTVLALAAGLEHVIERGSKRKIIVFRSMHSVGGQDLGFLPGSESEKMDPWKAATWDALESIVKNEHVMEEIRVNDLVQVHPLTFLRGRTFTDTWIIIDEAQNLERHVLLTVLSRLGENSKVVLCSDVAQRDNLHVGRYDGIQAVVEKLLGNDLFAHITLVKSERSRAAELVTRLLDE